MKKFLLTLLCLVMIAGAVSCGINDNTTNSHQSTGDTTTTQSDTSNNTTSTSQSGSETNENITNIINNSPQLEFYRAFEDAVNSNVYDEWLESTISGDLIPINQAYGKCCTYWENEFDFTIEKAKVLFEDETAYLEWQKGLYDWLEITKKVYQNETSLMDVAMNRLELVSPYCDLIRQKVIDTKYFCYILECNIIDNDTTNPIGLQWANDLSD